MEFFRIRKDIPFMRHALAFNIISLITFLLAVFFCVRSIRDGYWGKDAEEIKQRMLKDPD